MASEGNSEKDISVAFEKLSITSSDQTSSQTKNDSEYPPPVQSQILSEIQNIWKSENHADVKAVTKKINKTSGTRFDEGCITVNISQLLDKKNITNVKTPQHLDYFRLSTTEITSEDNRLSQVQEIALDDTQQCQQNTHFIRNLLDDIIIIKNALGNSDKSSDDTKITICHTNETSTIVQQFTSDNPLIPIPNDIHTPITKNHRASISASSFDESFRKLGFHNLWSKFIVNFWISPLE